MNAKLKNYAKASILRFWPTLYHLNVARRQRRMFRDKFLSFQTGIANQLYGRNGTIRVLSGPFAGMKYFNEAFYSLITSRWLGTYEMELHPVVEEIIDRHYRIIIDVGCAEGYYAVGLARRCPNAQIHAFDVDPWSRDQCRRLSQFNDVAARVHVRGLLKPNDVFRLAVSPTLIICDIEGFELSLLDPQTCPSMKECDLLVEIHEAAESSRTVEATLHQRFAETHQIDTYSVSARPDAVADKLFPVTSSSEDKRQAVNEHRPHYQRWMWIKRAPRMAVNHAAVG